MCFDKLLKKEPEHKGLEILLKVFLIIGIIAGLCVILKFVYDKFFRDNFCYCDDECDCGDDGCCCDDEEDDSDGGNGDDGNGDISGETYTGTESEQT